MPRRASRSRAMAGSNSRRKIRGLALVAYPIKAPGSEENLKYYSFQTELNLKFQSSFVEDHERYDRLPDERALRGRYDASWIEAHLIE